MTATTLDAPVVVRPPSFDDSEHYEIIDGQRVELPPMSTFASMIASRLVSKLDAFAEAHDIGRAVGETLFRFPAPRERNRRLDGAFVSHKRWPKERPVRVRDNAWDVVPDLAVEVISPNDFAEDVLMKVDEYLRVGASLVWVVYPSLRLIQIYEAMTRIRVVTVGDELDGGVVLPGFRVAVASLFPEALPEAGATSDN